MYFGPDIL